MSEDLVKKTNKTISKLPEHEQEEARQRQMEVITETVSDESEGMGK